MWYLLHLRCNFFYIFSIDIANEKSSCKMLEIMILLLFFHDLLHHWLNICRPYALRQKPVVMRLLAFLDYIERFGFSVSRKVFHKRRLFRLGRHVIGWLLGNFPHPRFIQYLVPNLRILDVHHHWVVYPGFLFCCRNLQ